MKEDFRQTQYILAFDQTLGNTGVALLAEDGGDPSILKTWLIKRPEDGLKGFAATYARAEALRTSLRHFFLREIGYKSITRVVHEMPAAYGYRTESSLIAGYVLQTVVADLGMKPPALIANQHAKKVLTGGPKATKAEVKAAVSAFLPEDGLKPWNEHTADAAMLGYTYIIDERGVTDV